MQENVFKWPTWLKVITKGTNTDTTAWYQLPTTSRAAEWKREISFAWQPRVCLAAWSSQCSPTSWLEFISNLLILSLKRRVSQNPPPKNRERGSRLKLDDSEMEDESEMLGRYKASLRAREIKNLHQIKENERRWATKTKAGKQHGVCACVCVRVCVSVHMCVCVCVCVSRSGLFTCCQQKLRRFFSSNRGTKRKMCSEYFTHKSTLTFDFEWYFSIQSVSQEEFGSWMCSKRGSTTEPKSSLRLLRWIKPETSAQSPGGFYRRISVPIESDVSSPNGFSFRKKRMMGSWDQNSHFLFLGPRPQRRIGIIRLTVQTSDKVEQWELENKLEHLQHPGKVK